MGNTLGERTLFTESYGRSIQLSADGKPKYKAGGVTIDWTTVPAISGSDVTYEDGVVVKVGEKALRYGSVVYRMGSGKFGLATDTTPDPLVRGETFLVNETWHEQDNMSDHPGVIDMGRVFRDRIRAGGAGQPTLANVLAVLPGITLAYD